MQKGILNLLWIPTDQEIKGELYWIKKICQQIGENNLCKYAKMAARQRKFAYAPYSKYLVGALILCQSGNIYPGNNCERVNYSETDHAEESAVTSAIIHGEVKKTTRKFIKAVFVSSSALSTPCGRCRQIIVEHADNALIVLADTKGEIVRIVSLRTLLPLPFTPEDLGYK